MQLELELKQLTRMNEEKYKGSYEARSKEGRRDRDSLRRVGESQLKRALARQKHSRKCARTTLRAMRSGELHNRGPCEHRSCCRCPAWGQPYIDDGT